jgi:hypothetical protein
MPFRIRYLKGLDAVGSVSDSLAYRGRGFHYRSSSPFGQSHCECPSIEKCPKQLLICMTVVKSVIATLA